MSEEPKISKLDELEMAFAFSDGMEDCQTYVSKRDGSIVRDDEMLSGEPCPVEDIEFDDDYVPLPDKRELDLGTRLVWRFVRQEIPGLEPKVREIFSRRGAYRRWKDFLDRNDLLDQWYSFENEATTQALLEWCEENGVPIQD
jgi:hypothetical protein